MTGAWENRWTLSRTPSSQDSRELTWWSHGQGALATLRGPSKPNASGPLLLPARRALELPTAIGPFVAGPWTVVGRQYPKVVGRLITEVRLPVGCGGWLPGAVSVNPVGPIRAGSDRQATPAATFPMTSVVKKSVNRSIHARRPVPGAASSRGAKTNNE